MWLSLDLVFNYMSDYELMLIFKTGLSEEDMSALIGKIKDLLDKHAKGEVVKTDDWGKRTLSYPIKNQTDGRYQVWQVKASPGGLAEFSTRLRREENVLRFLLTVK
ncbi:30S ribosomal protein S6 [candidate division WWE3 bacterium CG08_land_8_20_14_0_20_43_13]|uniref:Small ribosomal subunit protein bS6 n=1 Tax=candidate division WWE3 bacterium CG08_land_8_20_14_0_20_43_13 TaxID=1975087 RepID=A0A2H0X813_UNCKA|nr:MAG: 30S ribosomal protein S6 [candidate division WWE3 bacterium CG08_land_8_20_14_0_20_43_13]